jgi:hypothetical protein
MAGHRLFPHSAPRELVPGLWQITGRLSFPLLRNMTIWRLPSGGLLLHSLVALDDAGLAALQALGEAAVGVIPHGDHQMDAGWWRARFPGLKLVAPRRELPRIRREAHPVEAAEDVLPGYGIRLHDVPGIKYSEHALEIPLEGGRALILCDAFAHGDPYDPASRMTPVLRYMIHGTGGKFGVARIYRWTQVRRLADLIAFGRQLAALPDLRLVTFAHGEPLLRNIAPTMLAGLGPAHGSALHG